MIFVVVEGGGVKCGRLASCWRSVKELFILHFVCFWFVYGDVKIAVSNLRLEGGGARYNNSSRVVAVESIFVPSVGSNSRFTQCKGQEERFRKFSTQKKSLIFVVKPCLQHVQAIN